MWVDIIIFTVLVALIVGTAAVMLRAESKEERRQSQRSYQGHSLTDDENRRERGER